MKVGSEDKLWKRNFIMDLLKKHMSGKEISKYLNDKLITTISKK